MQAIWIRRHGGPEVLNLKQTPDPQPGPGQIRVATRACGLNFAEVMARQGLYPDAPKPPCIVGYEGAGIVSAIGPGVSSPGVGARVLFLARFGAHASQVVVPVEQALEMPESMSFEEGAALPVNYLTAHHMLFRVARVQGGEHVLVHMAAGGVGTAVLQLLKTVEGVVAYGTASAQKHDYVREQGCTHPIDYRTKDYAAQVRALTQGRGVDVVLDALGGKDWKTGYSLLRPAGILIAFGFANANRGGPRRLVHVLKELAQVPRWSPMKLMDDNRAVAGVNIGHLWGDLDLTRPQMEALVTLYREGKIKPHIGGSYPFSKAADAFAELEYRRNLGKILLTPDQPED